MSITTYAETYHTATERDTRDHLREPLPCTTVATRIESHVAHAAEGGRGMAKVHRSYRLDEDVVGRVSAWAEEHGTTTTQAVETLLVAALGAGDVPEAGRDTTALEAENEALREQRDILREYLATTKEHLSTLTAQVAEKDRQIERLQDIAEHSQMLEAAHVAGAIAGGTDVPQNETQEDARPRGVWAWLARKIEGR